MDDQFSTFSVGDTEKSADARVLRALQLMGNDRPPATDAAPTAPAAGPAALSEWSPYSLRRRSPSIGPTTRTGDGTSHGKVEGTIGRSLGAPDPTAISPDSDLALARAARLEAERRLTEASATLRSYQGRLEQTEAARDAADALLRELRLEAETLRTEKKVLEARTARAASARDVSRTRAVGKDQSETLARPRNGRVALNPDPEPVKWWR